MRAILVYALLRAALFVAPFAILVAANVQWYVALAIALLFAFAASAVFLRRFKIAAGEGIAAMRGERVEQDDEDVEDRAVDADATERAQALATDDAVDGTVATTDVDPDVVTDAERDRTDRDGR